MSAIAASAQVHVQVSENQTHSGIFNFPSFFPARRQYFQDSSMFQLKGGFTAEIIHQPGPKAGESGILPQLQHELGAVVLAAFNKPADEAEKYAPESVMVKNIIDVDWLVVVRKNGRPVACGSCSYITSYILYLNSAMVMPEYQSTGIGFISNGLLWRMAIAENHRQGLGEPELVCRTHNRNVASVLLHTFEHGHLSTEPHKNLYVQMVMKKVVNYLQCNYDERTGVSHGVYPEGLPEGTKTMNERVTRGFSGVGPTDACYVVGNLDHEYMERVLGRNLQTSLEETLLPLAA